MSALVSWIRDAATKFRKMMADDGSPPIVPSDTDWQRANLQTRHLTGCRCPGCADEARSVTVARITRFYGSIR